MPGFEHGVRRAVSELQLFFVFGLLLKVISELTGMYIVDEVVYLALCLISLKDIEKMKYWSTSYLAGYLLAQIAIVQAIPDPTSILAILAGLTIMVYRLARYVP